MVSEEEGWVRVWSLKFGSQPHQDSTAITAIRGNAFIRHAKILIRLRRMARQMSK